MISVERTTRGPVVSLVVETSTGPVEYRARVTHRDYEAVAAILRQRRVGFAKPEGAAEWIWAAYGARATGNALGDRDAMLAWWESIGPDGRQGARLNVLAIHDKAPQLFGDPPRAWQWWESSSRRYREGARAQFEASALEGLASAALEVLESPAFMALFPVLAAGTAQAIRDPLGTAAIVAPGLDKAAQPYVDQALDSIGGYVGLAKAAELGSDVLDMLDPELAAELGSTAQLAIGQVASDLGLDDVAGDIGARAMQTAQAAGPYAARALENAARNVYQLAPEQVVEIASRALDASSGARDLARSMLARARKG